MYTEGIYIPLVYSVLTLKFRARLAKMGDRYVIIIPAKYRKEAKPFKGKDVDVEMLAV